MTGLLPWYPFDIGYADSPFAQWQQGLYLFDATGQLVAASPAPTCTTSQRAFCDNGRTQGAAACAERAGLWPRPDHHRRHPGPLGQLIVNFFTNALTHAFPGDTAGNIWITSAHPADGTVKIVSKDDGGGIADAHIQKIFNPFFTTRLGQGGSGLGLSIAFNIATSVLGGTLEVVSAPGQGRTFTVVLPRVAPTVLASPA